MTDWFILLSMLMHTSLCWLYCLHRIYAMLSDCRPVTFWTLESSWKEIWTLLWDASFPNCTPVNTRAPDQLYIFILYVLCMYFDRPLFKRTQQGCFPAMQVHLLTQTLQTRVVKHHRKAISPQACTQLQDLSLLVSPTSHWFFNPLSH